MRILKLHPLLRLANNYVVDSPQPANISYWWNVGSLLGLSLIIQIVTGVTLAMHYNSSTVEAFNSVEHIMRDVNNGWLIRYLHSNTASAFFFLVYLHIGKGLYYGSYKAPRTLVWTIGTTIFILMMAIAFLGYVLPYGQMSLWGATVITNLMSAIPWIGLDIVQFIWGGFSVNNATLNRFFSLHFLLPFLLAGLVLMHLMSLHASAGSGNPVGTTSNIDKVPFSPYYVFKDLVTAYVYMFILSVFVFFVPNLLGDSENYVMANPMQTPPAIVPEWYLLPFYAILRSVPSKLFGVIFMFTAILIILALAMTDLAKLRGTQFKPLNKTTYFLFGVNLLFLMTLGAKHVESPFIEIGQLGTAIYFIYFILTSPTGSLTEMSFSQLFLNMKELFAKIGNLIKDVLSNLLPKPYVYTSLPLTSMPDIMPGVKCPNCLANGKTVWVISGKNCPQCNTPCKRDMNIWGLNIFICIIALASYNSGLTSAEVISKVQSLFSMTNYEYCDAPANWVSEFKTLGTTQTVCSINFCIILYTILAFVVVVLVYIQISRVYKLQLNYSFVELPLQSCPASSDGDDEMDQDDRGNNDNDDNMEVDQPEETSQSEQGDQSEYTNQPEQSDQPREIRFQCSRQDVDPSYETTNDNPWFPDGKIYAISADSHTGTSEFKQVILRIERDDGRHVNATMDFPEYGNENVRASIEKGVKQCVGADIITEKDVDQANNFEHISEQEVANTKLPVWTCKVPLDHEYYFRAKHEDLKQFTPTDKHDELQSEVDKLKIDSGLSHPVPEIKDHYQREVDHMQQQGDNGPGGNGPGGNGPGANGHGNSDGSTGTHANGGNNSVSFQQFDLHELYNIFDTITNINLASAVIILVRLLLTIIVFNKVKKGLYTNIIIYILYHKQLFDHNKSVIVANIRTISDYIINRAQSCISYLVFCLYNTYINVCVFINASINSSLSSSSPKSHAFIRFTLVSMPEPVVGVKCPECAKKGKNVWVLPGKNCPVCGTNCKKTATTTVIIPTLTFIVSTLTITILLDSFHISLLELVATSVQNIKLFILNIFSFEHCDAPRPWGLYFQDSASPQMEALVELHDNIMFYLVIILFAVGWIIYAIMTEQAKGGVNHKYVSHGTLIELIWTLSPGFILLFIAFTSFKLLYLMDEVSDIDMTLYIEGHQWYWSYQYPDFMTDDGNYIEYDSYLTPESDLENGALRMLDVDERVIIPEVTHTRFLISSGDVIHSYACPSLGIKADAYPGRLNQASALINRLGTFYGQCSEICGILHSSMPITIESVSLEKFLVFLEEK